MTIFFLNSNYIYIIYFIYLLLIQSILWSIRLLLGKIISSDSERPKTKLIWTFKLSRLFFFWLCLMTCMILVSQPGIEPRCSAVKVQHSKIRLLGKFLSYITLHISLLFTNMESFYTNLVELPQQIHPSIHHRFYANSGNWNTSYCCKCFIQFSCLLYHFLDP